MPTISEDKMAVAPLGTPRTRNLLHRVTVRSQRSTRPQARGFAARFRKQIAPMVATTEPQPGERDRRLAGKDRIRARKAARRS